MHNTAKIYQGMIKACSTLSLKFWHVWHRQLHYKILVAACSNSLWKMLEFGNRKYGENASRKLEILML